MNQKERNTSGPTIVCKSLCSAEEGSEREEAETAKGEKSWAPK